MKRYPHYWWPCRGASCPGTIAVLDCDSDPPTAPGGGNPGAGVVTRWHLSAVRVSRGRPVLPHAVGGEAISTLWDSLASLCSRRGTTWLFIDHAIDTLTTIGLWDRLLDGRVRLAGKDWTAERGDGKSGEDVPSGLCVIEDPPTLVLCQFKNTAGKLLILDVRNYGIDTTDLPTGTAERSAVLLGGILSIVQTLREGVPVSLRGTAASQAVSILRTRHDVRRLHCHTHPLCLQLERSAYFGGRVECYRTGVIPGPVYHLDVRSMYPSIGMTLPIPVSIRSYTDDGARAEAVGMGRPCDCLADVTLRHGLPAFPQRIEGETVYPVGDYRTCLCGPELRRAVECGAITRWHACARYTCAPVLAGFYRWGLALRERFRADGNDMAEQWIKRVMTGLVGKFGEPGRRWVGCPPRTEMGPFDEWYGPGPDGRSTRYRNVAWHTQRLERHGESYWSMPAVAGWITSAARVRLWDYIAAAGRENVWYVDTDGLLCGPAGYDRLLRGGFIRDGAAGHLRIVGSYSSCTIYGVRHYVLGDTTKCAGVPHGAIREGETREDYFGRVPQPAETTLGRVRRMMDERDRQ